MRDEKSGKIIDSNNLKLHPRMKDFYKFFKYNGKIVDIFDFEESLLNIFSREILRKIKVNEDGWEDDLPQGIAEMIKKNEMFGYEGTKTLNP